MTRKLFRVALLALAAGAATLPAPRAAAAQQTAYRFGKVIDGRGNATSDGVIVVERDRIISTGQGAAAIPRGAAVVDLRRYTAIPGLIDAHTHMTYFWDQKPGTVPWTQSGGRRPQLTVFLAQENARRTLETGVTTVRDLGSSNYSDIVMRDLINSGAMIGPRMFVAGYGLQKPRTPPRAGAPSGVPRGRAMDTTEIALAVKAAVDAAHKLGRKIAIHSYGPVGGRDAMLAGAETVEHPVDLDDSTLVEFARRGTFYVPTIDHNRYYADNRAAFGYTNEQAAALDEFRARNFETAKRAFAAGVKFGMGSDAVFTGFGENTKELGWYVKLGMTPAQALATATTNGAAILGRESELGAIAPGFFADIVAVEGDPLADIDVVINKVRWVMKGGAVVVDKRKQ
jgi:imidazolonepropionase-like amidohydrolase